MTRVLAPAPGRSMGATRIGASRPEIPPPVPPIKTTCPYWPHNLPSVAQMKYLAGFFGDIAWWTLEPHPEFVQEQPADPLRKIAFARSVSGDLAVAYLPDNLELNLDLSVFPSAMRAQWINPVTGRSEAAAATPPAPGPHTFIRPAGWEDALLLLTAVRRKP